MLTENLWEDRSRPMKKLSLQLFIFLCLGGNAFALTIWHKERSSSRTFIEGIAQDFSKANKVNATFDYVYSEAIKSSLLRSAMLKGKMPDAAIVPSDFVGLYKQLTLSEIPKDSISKETSKSFLDTATIDGKIYGVPLFSGNHLMLFYNKRFVKKPAASFEEMLTQKKDFDAKGIKTLGMKYQEMYWLAPFVLGNGGRLVNGNQITLNSSAMVKALEQYRKIVDLGLSEKNCGFDCISTDFYAGKFAYAIDGEWSLGSALDALGENLGVALIPTFDGVQPRTYHATNVLIFPAQSLAGPQREILLKFARYLQSYDIQMRAYSSAKRFPVDRRVLKNLSQTIDPAMRGALDQLNFSEAMPSNESQAIAWEGMGLGFKYFISDKLNAKDAAAFMQSSVNADEKSKKP